MVEESTLADTNSTVVESLVQAEVDITRIVPHMNKEEGSLFSHACWEEQDKQRIETPTVGLGQPISGLDNITCNGPNTRTWKRLQHQPMAVGTIVSKDVGVGTKCKHKPKLNLTESTENPKAKKRRGDYEVLEVSALSKNEFGSAVAARQHHSKQRILLLGTIRGLGTTT